MPCKTNTSSIIHLLELDQGTLYTVVELAHHQIGILKGAGVLNELLDRKPVFLLRDHLLHANACLQHHPKCSSTNL